MTLFNWFNADTYQNVHLKAAADTEAAPAAALAAAPAGIVIAAVVIIGGHLPAMRRRQAETE